MSWVTDNTKKDAVPMFVPPPPDPSGSSSLNPPSLNPSTPATPPASRSPATVTAAASVAAAPGPSNISIPNNASNSLSNGPQRIICIPFQWQRIRCSMSESFYYITPSGHVLLDRNDVKQYLEQRYTCKCFLKLHQRVEEVFDFSIDVNHVNSTDSTNSGIGRCELWAQTLPESYLRAQMLRAQSHLSSQEVDGFKEIYRILQKQPERKLPSTYDEKSFYSWLSTFEWDAIRVTRDGRMFTGKLTPEQLKHLTYELSNTQELNMPTRVASAAPICDSAPAALPIAVPTALPPHLPPPALPLATHLSGGTNTLLSSSPFAPTSLTSSSSTTPTPLALPVQPSPKQVKVFQSRRQQPQSTQQPQITTPPMALGQQHLQPVVQPTFQLQTNSQAPIKIGSTVTSSIPASLAVGFKSTSGRKKAGGAPGKVSAATSAADASIIQPVMIVSNTPTTGVPPFLNQQSQGFFSAPVARPPPAQQLLDLSKNIPKGCKELIIVNDGSVRTPHFIMNGRSKHMGFVPTTASLPTFSLPGSSTSISTPTSTTIPKVPVTFDMKQAKALIAQLTSAKQQLEDAKAEQSAAKAAAAQPKSPVTLVMPPTAKSPSKKPVSKITRKARMTKAETAAKEQLEQAAAMELRKQNELAANRESECLQVLANVMNAPHRTKQEDSGHLRFRRPISPLSLPRFESSFQTKADRLITAEPLKPLPTIDTLMQPNRPLKYIQILNPPTVGTLVQSAATTRTTAMTSAIGQVVTTSLAGAETSAPVSSTVTESFLQISDSTIAATAARPSETVVLADHPKSSTKPAVVRIKVLDSASNKSSSISGITQLPPQQPFSSPQLAPLTNPLQPQRQQPSLFTYQKSVQSSLDNEKLVPQQPQQEMSLPQAQPLPLPSSSSSSHTFEPYEMVNDPAVNRLDFAASLLALGRQVITNTSTSATLPPAPIAISETTPFAALTQAAEQRSIEENNNNNISEHINETGFHEPAPETTASQLPSQLLQEKLTQCADTSLSAAYEDAMESSTAVFDLRSPSKTAAATAQSIERNEKVAEECESMRFEAASDVASEATQSILEYDNHDLQHTKEDLEQVLLTEDEPQQLLQSLSLQPVSEVKPSASTQGNFETIDRKESTPKKVRADDAVPTDSVVDVNTVLPMEESTDTESSLERNPTAAQHHQEKEESSLNDVPEVAASPPTPPPANAEESQAPIENDSAMQVECEGGVSNSEADLEQGEKHSANDSVNQEPMQEDSELTMDDDVNDGLGEQGGSHHENGGNEVEENEENDMNSHVKSLSSHKEPETSMPMDEESDDTDEKENGDEEKLLNSSKEQTATLDEEGNDRKVEEAMDDYDVHCDDVDDEDEEVEIDDKSALPEVFPKSSSFSPNDKITDGVVNTADNSTVTATPSQSSSPQVKSSTDQPSPPTFLTIPGLSASPPPSSAAAAERIASPSGSSSTTPPSPPPSPPPDEPVLNEKDGGTTTAAVEPAAKRQDDEDQSVMDDDQSTTSTSTISSPFEQPPPDSPLATFTATAGTTSSTSTSKATNTAGAGHVRSTRTSSPDSPASRGSRTSSRTSRSSQASRSSPSRMATAVRVARTVRPSRGTRSERSFLVNRASGRASRSSSSSQSSSRSSSPKNLTVTGAAAASAAASSTSSKALNESVCSSLSLYSSSSPKATSSRGSRRRHHSSGGNSTGGGANTADDDGEGDNEQKLQQKRMERLKKELEFQGRPVKDNLEEEENVDRMSPPLPPQERVFKIGDIVFGQRGDVRYWPGKLISYGRSTRVDRAVPSDAKVTVLWYGKSVLEKETLMTVNTLLTLTEGLEEHHRLKKRTRSGNLKRMNHDLEDAIQEAVGWNEPEVLTSSSET